MFHAINVCGGYGSGVAVPALAAIRMRDAIVSHSEVLLRIALVCGSFVGYALSEIAR
jgi:hypothetical protein